MKLLLIEDDEYTAATLAQALTTHHYSVNTTNNGQTGLDLAKTYDYDLIVLDLVIPGLDGINFCRQIRAQGYQIPILILTAKDSSTDRVMGLEAGADDYMVKPFDLPELIARIRALLRRGREISPTVLTWDNLQLDLHTQEVTYFGQTLHLTPKEYGLLELFLRNPRRIFSRSAILDRVWSFGEFPGEEAVRTHIMGLRQKLKTGGISGDLIETIYGFGYRLKTPKTEMELPAKSQEKARVKKGEKEKLDQLSTAEVEILTALEEMWLEFKQSFLADLQLFEQTIVHLATGNIDTELREQARMKAHRLIGALGTFGVTKGSEIARNIGQLLENIPIFAPEDAAKLSQLVQALQQTICEREQFKDSHSSTGERVASSLENTVASPGKLAKVKLLVINDEVLSEQIKNEANTSGLQVEGVSGFAAAKNTIADSDPDVILLNLAVPQNGENGLTFLAELTCHYSSIPILVISENSRLTERVAVARLGGKAFLQKPISAGELLPLITQVLDQPQGEEAKVLIVDDDPFVLGILSVLLEPWGLQVITLQNPQKFWEVLEASTPDLLILDVEMPNFSGLDLCQVVRNDPRWGELPILFLSAHKDTETVLKVFSVGGDDYVSKPIVEPELVARVLNRLERRQHSTPFSLKE